MRRVFTTHASTRMGQRNISQEEIETCLTLGEVIYQRGSEIFYLSKKLCDKHGLSKSYQGIAVILDKTGDVIISVFRTSDRRRLVKTMNSLKKRCRLSRRQLYYQQRLVQSAAV